ncbi:unnamed protein product [Cuscuta epithymum]|uniref:Pectin acetylesterase n=1 Tax=Cuscuta epithymum TaxID=186058 RepID=A0AAV0EL77_9ASTE|nr:unnamed protein product [Cuscuta epithymum]CAH9124487.1 unnamed protein product [Cuscuta epithymum]
MGLEMTTLFAILLCVCFLLTKSDGSDDYFVNATIVRNDPRAVCLTGKPASYYFDSGFSTGMRNWLVYLQGGAWCNNLEFCVAYAQRKNLTLDPKPYPFDYILSNKKEVNPDFFNWNRVVVRYCDGSSFTSDSERIFEFNGTKLYFRGARIYKAVMQELLHKLGMSMAENALLVGGSAGGVAVALHCDGFHDLLPHATRVKCLSDAGYFFPSKKFGHGEIFTPTFQGVMAHVPIKALPEECTSRLSPYLCFFPQNVQQYIKTPIFFLMSAFDTVQVTWTFSANDTIKECLTISHNCSNDIIKTLQDLRLEFLSVLPKQSNTTSSRGILITSSTTHEQLSNYRWNSDMVVDGSNETIAKLFGNWYFGRKSVQVIDKYQCPYNCSSSLVPNGNKANDKASGVVVFYYGLFVLILVFDHLVSFLTVYY